MISWTESGFDSKSKQYMCRIWSKMLYSWFFIWTFALLDANTLCALFWSVHESLVKLNLQNLNNHIISHPCYLSIRLLSYPHPPPPPHPPPTPIHRHPTATTTPPPPTPHHPHHPLPHHYPPPPPPIPPPRTPINSCHSHPHPSPSTPHPTYISSHLCLSHTLFTLTHQRIAIFAASVCILPTGAKLDGLMVLISPSKMADVWSDE